MNETRVRVVCDRCGRRLGVSASLAGKRGQCPECGHQFTIPDSSSLTGGRIHSGGSWQAPARFGREELEARVAELESRERDAREGEERTRLELVELRAAMTKKGAELARVREDLENSASALREARERVLRLEAEVAASRELFRQLELEAAGRQERALCAQREAAELGERAARVDLECVDWKSRAQKAEAESSRLAWELRTSEESRKEALREFKEEILSLYEEKEALLRRETQAEEETAEARSREDAAHRDLSEARSRIAESESSLERLAVRLHDLEEASRVESRGLSEEASLLAARRIDSISRQIEAALAEADRLRTELLEAAPRATGEVPEKERAREGTRKVLEREERPATSAVRGFRDLRSVGFDFGTSTTVISFYKGVSEQGVFEIGTDARGGYRRLAVPSVLGYLETEDRFVFGEEAAELPSNLAGYRKIPSVKRCLLCEGVNEALLCANLKNTANHDVCGRGVESWHIGKRRYETEDLIARYIHHLLDRVERKYSVRLEPPQVHFTVPVYFGYIARKKMREGVRRAFALLRGVSDQEVPIESITLIHEPSAAAVSQYNQFRDMPDEVFCVFDMGGGTTDVAVFEKRKGELWCLGSGSAQVGGDNLDQILKEIVLGRIASWPAQSGVEARRTFGPLIDQLSEIRERLSLEEEVRRRIVLPEGEFELVVTRQEFEERIGETVGRSIDVLTRTFEGVAPILERFDKRLAGVYLVGGATQTPLVRRRVLDAVRTRAPGVEVRQATKFSGVESSPKLEAILEREFHILSVALGAGFPPENFREYVLDKIPFEVGLVFERDESLVEYPAKKLVPFYHAFEPLPKTEDREVVVSQSPGNVLNVYMKREGETFYKILKYLKFPYRQGRRLRYMPTEGRIEERYRIRIEVTRDLLVVHFGDLTREKVFVPGCHPYYFQRDIQLDWVDRLSTVQDLRIQLDGQASEAEADAVQRQNHLRRRVQEKDPVRLEKNGDGRYVVLHDGEVLGLLQEKPGVEELLREPRSPVVKFVKEDILLPEDVAGTKGLNPQYQAGDKFVVFDVEFEGAVGEAPEDGVGSADTTLS